MELLLRHRNRLLIAAGFAPNYAERTLDDAEMKPALAAVELVLKGHEPYPAIAVDRAWNMVLANDAASWFLQDIRDPSLLAPPINVLRLALHPNGLAPRIVNFSEWRGHLLTRLRHQIETSADPKLEALEQELLSYAPGGKTDSKVHADPTAGIALPMQVTMDGMMLSFISTVTIFGTPLDVTLSELAIESFFPADAATGEYLRGRAAQR
jgi:hypothetical protein